MYLESRVVSPIRTKRYYFKCYIKQRGLGSSVGIMTDYRLDDPGSNPVGDKIFRLPDRPRGQPSLLYNGYRVFPGGRDGRGVGLTPHSYLECRCPRKSGAIPLLTLRAFVVYETGENLPILNNAVLHDTCTAFPGY